MAGKPEKAQRPEKEEPTQVPKQPKPKVRHPLLAGAAIGLAALLGAKGAKPQEAPPAPTPAAATSGRVASAETRGVQTAPTRPAMVAQATTSPTTASDTTVPVGGQGGFMTVEMQV